MLQSLEPLREHLPLHAAIITEFSGAPQVGDDILALRLAATSPTFTPSRCKFPSLFRAHRPLPNLGAFPTTPGGASGSGPQNITFE